MLTAHCRRAAGLLFLQINGSTYYFPNCPLAQFAVWGTSSPGMNTVASISSHSPVQACAMRVSNCVCVVRHLRTAKHLKCSIVKWQNLKDRKEKRSRCTAVFPDVWPWWRASLCGSSICPRRLVVRLLFLRGSKCIVWSTLFSPHCVLHFWREFFFSLILNIFQCLPLIWRGAIGRRAYSSWIWDVFDAVGYCSCYPSERSL